MNPLKNTIRTILILAAVIAMVLGSVLSLKAAGSATLDVVYDWNGEHPNSLNVSLYKIADETGSVLNEYASVAIGDILEDLADASASQTLADSLEAWITENALQADFTAKNDESGIAQFAGLDAGVYLIQKETWDISTDPDDPVRVEFSNALVQVTEGSLQVYPKAFIANEMPQRFEVYLIWQDEGFEDQRPESFLVQALCSSQKQLELSLNSQSDWKDAWKTYLDGDWSIVPEDLDAYDITWKQEENRFFIYASRKEEPSVQDAYTVNIVWADQGHEDVRPEGVTVAISKDGQLAESVVLNESASWTYTWQGDADALWSVEQSDLPDRYSQELVVSGHTFTFINSYQNQLQVVKLWSAGSDPLESVSMDLYKGTQKTETVVLSAENNWTYSWQSSLDASYWHVEEQSLEGWKASYEVSGDTFMCINSKIQSSETPKDDDDDNPLHSAPNTAASSQAALWAGLSVSALAVMAVLAKKRRSQS